LASCCSHVCVAPRTCKTIGSSDEEAHKLKDPHNDGNRQNNACAVHASQGCSGHQQVHKVRIKKPRKWRHNRICLCIGGGSHQRLQHSRARTAARGIRGRGSACQGPAHEHRQRYRLRHVQVAHCRARRALAQWRRHEGPQAASDAREGFCRERACGAEEDVYGEQCDAARHGRRHEGRA
jgi:hypothetical protein